MKALEAAAYPYMATDDQSQTRGHYAAILNEYEEKMEADLPDVAAARMKAQEEIWAQNRAALAQTLAKR